MRINEMEWSINQPMDMEYVVQVRTWKIDIFVVNVKEMTKKRRWKQHEKIPA